MLLYSSIYPVCKPLHHRARRWQDSFLLFHDSELGVPANLKNADHEASASLTAPNELLDGKSKGVPLGRR
jgi:hypothetical protein